MTIPPPPPPPLPPGTLTKSQHKSPFSLCRCLFFFCSRDCDKFRADASFGLVTYVIDVRNHGHVADVVLLVHLATELIDSELFHAKEGVRRERREGKAALDFGCLGGKKKKRRNVVKKKKKSRFRKWMRRRGRASMTTTVTRRHHRHRR